MVEAVAETGNPQGVPEKGGPTGGRADRIMVHLKRTGPVGWAGHGKNSKTSTIMNTNRCEERDSSGSGAAADPNMGTTPASIANSADAT